MITQVEVTEFGQWVKNLNHGHNVNNFIDEPVCCEFYKEPKGEWLSCPCCGLKPKVWEFDNGRQTACGCANSKYDHFSVHAESIMSVHARCGGNISEYDSDQLRKNWNEYCQTMINPCSHGDLIQLGRW